MEKIYCKNCSIRDVEFCLVNGEFYCKGCSDYFRKKPSKKRYYNLPKWNKKKKRKKKKGGKYTQQPKKKEGKRVLSKSNYSDYMKSEIWKRVRTRKLIKENNTCRICKNKANQVHHWKYPTHWGCEKDRAIDAVCNACHELLHNELGDMLKEVKQTAHRRLGYAKIEVVNYLKLKH